jgi:hypothetical protein
MKHGASSILVLLLASSVVAQEVPLGDQFQVNDYITGPQEHSAIASDDQGNFVVVWLNDHDPTFWISGRLFFADGTPASDEFQVNTMLAGELGYPRVAMAGDGRFVVVWHDSGGLDGSGYSVRGQRYWADGTPFGTEMQLNTTWEGVQAWASVTMRDDGSFLAVWQGNTAHDDYGVGGQAFNWDGTPYGGEIAVNDFTDGWTDYPDVSINDNNQFAVVWGSSESPGGDPDDSIQVRCFLWGGMPLGPQQQVNTYTDSDQYQSAVAVAPNGDFLVVYNLHWTLGLGGRFFLSSCTPGGAEFSVSSSLDGGYWPDVTVDDQGRYVATWVWNRVWGRMLTASGVPIGDEEFGLSFHDTFYGLGHPKVSAAPDGQFVATWHSNGSTGNDNDQYSIQARRFAGWIGIFADAFETGDLAAWSDTSP